MSINTRFWFKFGFILSIFALTTSTNANSLIRVADPADKQAYFYDLNGKRQSLNHYLKAGKWLVVMIWAENCSACNKEIGQYIKLHEKLKNSHAQVLGISIDGWSNRKLALDFIKRHKVTFPNLLIEKKDLPQFFQPITNKYFVGTPTFMIYSRDKRFEGSQAGAIPADVIEKYILQNDKK